MVSCRYVRAGCKWTGKSSNEEEHVKTECKYSPVPCPNNCGSKKILRKDLSKHMLEECHSRIHCCKNCGEEGTYASITTEHVCGSERIKCPKCKKYIQKGLKEEHMEKYCEFKVISCPYDGCTVALPKKDMPRHLKSKDHKRCTPEAATDPSTSEQEMGGDLNEGHPSPPKRTVSIMCSII